MTEVMAGGDVPGAHPEDILWFETETSSVEKTSNTISCQRKNRYPQKKSKRNHIFLSLSVLYLFFLFFFFEISALFFF